LAKRASLHRLETFRHDIWMYRLQSSSLHYIASPAGAPKRKKMSRVMRDGFSGTEGAA